MSKVIVLSPLDESYLGDEFRLHPLHLGHLLGRHAAAPVGGLAARKIREWAASGLKRLQLGEHLSPHVWRKPGSDLSGGQTSRTRRPSANKGVIKAFARSRYQAHPRTDARLRASDASNGRDKSTILVRFAAIILEPLRADRAEIVCMERPMAVHPDYECDGRSRQPKSRVIRRASAALATVRSTWQTGSDSLPTPLALSPIHPSTCQGRKVL